jgi:hypothetical protein
VSSVRGGRVGRGGAALGALLLLGCARGRGDARPRAGDATATASAGSGVAVVAGDGSIADAGGDVRAVCEGLGVTLPERGSPVRKAVVEVVRAHLATKQEFKVDRVVVARDWAYFEGVEQIENGRRVAALLRRQRGAWTAAEVLTAAGPEGMPGLRERLRADSRKPPPQLFGRD